MASEKRYWDRRFDEGSYTTEPEPPAELRAAIDWFPAGRALDVATGTGRLSVFLATHGYEVDALDQSRVGLEIARERAAEQGVEANWIQADAARFDYPESTYAVVTLRSARLIDRLSDLKAALEPGGVLFCQDHLRSSEPTSSGPTDDRYRLASNELLRANLDLTVLRYAEFFDDRPNDRSAAYAQVIARKPGGSEQPLPSR